MILPTRLNHLSAQIYYIDCCSSSHTHIMSTGVGLYRIYMVMSFETCEMELINEQR